MDLSDMKVSSLDFYNPKGCMINLGISLLSGTIQIKMAQSENKEAQMSKDTVIKYDHKNALFFSINSVECVDLSCAIPQLINGTYINPDPHVSENMKSSFSLVHYKENSPNRLFVFGVNSKDRIGEFKTLRLLIIPAVNRNENEKFMYTFRRNEERVFIEFIKRGCDQLPFLTQFFNAMVKLSRKTSFDNKNKPKSNNTVGYVETNDVISNNMFATNNPPASAPKKSDDDIPPWEDLSSNSPVSPSNNNLETMEDPFNLAF